jgi:hypothetical protein
MWLQSRSGRQIGNSFWVLSIWVFILISILLKFHLWSFFDSLLFLVISWEAFCWASSCFSCSYLVKIFVGLRAAFLCFILLRLLLSFELFFFGLDLYLCCISKKKKIGAIILFSIGYLCCPPRHGESFWFVTISSDSCPQVQVQDNTHQWKVWKWGCRRVSWDEHSMLKKKQRRERER